jgi:putative SOS response-associated peptidase YedK
MCLTPNTDIVQKGARFAVYEGPHRAAGMTTEPNALTVSINHERMPVLLSDEAEFETWLSGTPAEAFLAISR